MASIFANAVAVFIIIATGATLFVHGDHTVLERRRRAGARADRRPLRRGARCRPARRPRGAFLAAAIILVTAAYVIAETFSGLGEGLARRPREAPVFAATLGRCSCSSAPS